MHIYMYIYIYKEERRRTPAVDLVMVAGRRRKSNGKMFQTLYIMCGVVWCITCKKLRAQWRQNEC